MRNREAYLYYEAGQAVAAAHLGLVIRHVSGDPVQLATDIVLPRNQPKVRMILWLTGMAAEKRGAGATDPLRRTRTPARIRATIESIAAAMKGDAHERHRAARILVNQAQDRANAICSSLYDAIERIAAALRESVSVDGPEVARVVREEKTLRSARGKVAPESPSGGQPDGRSKPRPPASTASRTPRGARKFRKR